jgi:hypothetical protein
MDPITQSIVLGIASNALTTLIGTMGKAGKRLLSKSGDKRNQKVIGSNALVSLEGLPQTKECAIPFLRPPQALSLGRFIQQG